MTVVRTRYGNMHIVDSDQVISRSLSLYGEWAQNELALQERIAVSGACVLDVGAFVGTHTLAFSRFVGPTGKVYSFEPRREIYTVLSKNIATNACSNVRALNVGLGSTQRTLRLPCMDLTRPGNFGGMSLAESVSHPGSYESRIETIDGLDIGKIDFIKLDVEGMERQVLDGAHRAISQYQPLILCECNSITAGADLLEFCRLHDYSAHGFLAAAYNPNNFNEVQENIFGDSNEVMLLLLPKQRPPDELGEFFSERLHHIATLEDLVLPMLHKPQYAYEVLAHTVTGMSLGIKFPSPAIAPYVDEIAAQDKELLALSNEVARIKGTVSWKITGPLRVIRRVISRAGRPRK
jgi:FkbM family methyltransferase